MKKINLFFIFLFSVIYTVNSLAAPIEGPNMPNNKFWKTGLESNVIIKAEMKSPKSSVKSNQFFLTASYGITDWLCFDGKLGVGDITYDIEDSQKIKYSTNFAGGYGGRILLRKDKKHDINYILGLHHISVHPNTAKIGGLKHEAIMDEWQASLLFSKKICKFTPYAAGKFSKIFLIRKINDSRKRVRPEDEWGFVAGTDFDINNNARFNLEARLFDETSLTVNFNYTF